MLKLRNSPTMVLGWNTTKKIFRGLYAATLHARTGKFSTFLGIFVWVFIIDDHVHFSLYQNKNQWEAFVKRSVKKFWRNLQTFVRILSSFMITY
jgi:hypothetical protein